MLDEAVDREGRTGIVCEEGDDVAFAHILSIAPPSWPGDEQLESPTLAEGEAYHVQV